MHARWCIRGRRSSAGCSSYCQGHSNPPPPVLECGLPIRPDVLFLKTWNSVSLLQEFGLSQAAHHVWTDASGGFGCGTLWRTKWLQFQWPAGYHEAQLKLKDDSIMLKELLPVWANSSMLIHCDNLGAVSVINSGYSKVPQIMHLLRCLFSIRAVFHISVRAAHVPGRENTLADAISHGNLDLLFSQIPEARDARCQVPQELLALLVDAQLDWTSPAWSQLFANCFLQV